jgi:hypothetical protein
MKKYYYSTDGGERKGPVTLEELKLIEGFSAGTLVWYEGLSDWVRAEELSDVFAPAVEAKPAKSKSESKKSIGMWALGLAVIYAVVQASYSDLPKMRDWIARCPSPSFRT